MDDRIKEKIKKLLRDREGSMAWLDLVNAISGDAGGLSTAHLLIQELEKSETIEIDQTIIRLKKK